MQDLFNDENIGFTPEERASKIRWLCFSIIFNLLLVCNSGYVVYVCFDHLLKGGNNKNMPKIIAMWLTFCIIFVIRLIKSFYILCKWRNKKINPTIKESRVEFYSFFTIGLIEVNTQIIALYWYFGGVFDNIIDEANTEFI